MHYPPETASVMLIAQMIATVLQVSIFIESQLHEFYMFFTCDVCEIGECWKWTPEVRKVDM